MEYEGTAYNRVVAVFPIKMEYVQARYLYYPNSNSNNNNNNNNNINNRVNSFSIRIPYMFTEEAKNAILEKLGKDYYVLIDEGHIVLGNKYGLTRETLLELVVVYKPSSEYPMIFIQKPWFKMSVKKELVDDVLSKLKFMMPEHSGKMNTSIFMSELENLPAMSKVPSNVLGIIKSSVGTTVKRNNPLKRLARNNIRNHNNNTNLRKKSKKNERRSSKRMSRKTRK